MFGWLHISHIRPPNRPAGSIANVSIQANFRITICMDSSENKGTYISPPICIWGWFMARGHFSSCFLNMPSNPIIFTFLFFIVIDLTFTFSSYLFRFSPQWWLNKNSPLQNSIHKRAIEQTRERISQRKLCLTYAQKWAGVNPELVRNNHQNMVPKQTYEVKETAYGPRAEACSSFLPH